MKTKLPFNFSQTATSIFCRQRYLKAYLFFIKRVTCVRKVLKTYSTKLKLSP